LATALKDVSADLTHSQLSANFHPMLDAFAPFAFWTSFVMPPDSQSATGAPKSQAFSASKKGHHHSRVKIRPHNPISAAQKVIKSYHLPLD
jgi:hypothetical protein